MIINALPLADGVLAVRLEGTLETIDSFLYDLLLRDDSVRLLTATDTIDAIDAGEDCKSAKLLIQIDMRGGNSPCVA